MYIFYTQYGTEMQYQVAAYCLPTCYDTSWWRVPGITHEDE